MDFPDKLDSNARVGVRKGTGTTYERRRVSLIEGTNVSFTVADDPTNEEVDVTVAVASAAPSGAAGGTLGGTYPNPTVNTDGSTLETNSNALRVKDGGITQAKLASEVTEDLLPPGVIAPYAATTAPTGWLLCDGSAVSRSTYAALFSVISTTFGVGDNSTTFNVPDLRGRIPVALDNLGGSDAGRLSVANTLGGTGGAQTHTLTSAEMPAHTHTTGEAISGGGFIAFTGGAQGLTTTSGSTGGGGAHNNMQPYVLTAYIIKT